MDENLGWIGVDLDGTLAQYPCPQGGQGIGTPVPRMLQRVRAWLAAGRDVRVFTARVGPQADPASVTRSQAAIQTWCKQHLGRVLPVTATKDFSMAELWDDRCVQVWSNTGQRADGLDEAGAESREAADIGDLLAQLIEGPMPASTRDYRRALAMAAVLGRQMKGQEQSLLEACKQLCKPWLRLPTLPEMLKNGGGSSARVRRNWLRLQ